MSLKKYEYFQHKVRLLSHIVTEIEVDRDPETVTVVKNWPVPQNVKERLKLCWVTHYFRFAPLFSDIAHYLYKLIEKGEVFM